MRGKGIHHSRPCVGEGEWRRLREVVRSAHLAQGPQVRAFEEEVAQTFGLSAGVATSSGTAALHLALLTLGIGPGDEVLLPSYVCTAPLQAVLYVGDSPVLVDVDPKTGNIDPDDLRRRLTPRSKAVIAVHLHGIPAPVEELLSYSIPIIEDCAQSLGATLGGRKAGSFGHLTICSFYATKLITTGEGGMVLSSRADYLEKLKDLRDYDKREDFKVRYNYKMSDLEAAMGRHQLTRLDSFLHKRNSLAAAYDERLQSVECEPPPRVEGRIYYRYVVNVSPSSVQRIIDRLALRGVEAARPVFRPLHQHLGLTGGYAGAEACWNTHLSLPLHPDLSLEEVDEICSALGRIMEEHKR